MQRNKIWVWVSIIVAALVLGLVLWRHNTTAQNLQQQNTITGSHGARRDGGAIAVKLATAVARDFPLIARSYGTMASPGVVNINARISSQIMQVRVQDGQYVKKGDVLIVLDDRGLLAALARDQATLAKDQAALTNADSQLLRAKTLAARGVGPLVDVDNATAAQKSAAEVVGADKAVIDADKLQLEFATITAPFGGKLGAITAVPGALVSANGTADSGLMSITRMQPLKVNFRLPEQVLPDFRSVMGDDKNLAAANITVRVYTSGTNQLRDAGTLTFIDSAVDPASGTIAMSADVGNSQFTLWPGERVGIEVEYGTVAGAVTIPAVAVQQGQIGSYVWLVDDQNKVTATPVKVSHYEGNDAAIASGISLGQQVVIEGQAKLANGTEVRTVKAHDAKPDQPQ